MFMLKFVAVAAIAAVSNAAPASIRHVMHEKRQTHSSDWVKVARIEGSAILPMRIGLTQSNLHKGHDLLMEVYVLFGLIEAARTAAKGSIEANLSGSSHPDSPKYGKYWTQDEIHYQFAPAEETVQAVREWLQNSGIEDSRIVHSDNKGWLAFDATVEEAENLLLTEYYEHEHRHSSNVRVGCDGYHVPEHISPHVDYITPGIKLTPVVKRDIKVARRSPPAIKKAAHHTLPMPEHGIQLPAAAGKLPPDVQGCGFNITPPCWKALYKLPKVNPPATPGNSLGLYEQGDYIAVSDIQSWLATYAPYVPPDHLPIPALIDGAAYSFPANNTAFVGGEANIDVDIATSLIYPQTVTLYQTDDQIYAPQEVALVNTFNTFLDALDGSYCTYRAYGETGNDPAIDPVYPDPAPGGYKGKLQCGVYKPTNVISASYGECEQDLPYDYTARQCNEFMKLGLQGVSIAIASGDYGVASVPGDGGPNGCLGPEGKIFNPQYPCNCPYVTCVGGTQLYANQTVLDKESVMQVNLGGSAANFSSSGGFSNYFPQPDYQKKAVAQYFARHNPPYPYYSELHVDVNTTKGLYNRIGRAYPDVASNGAYMPTYVNGVLDLYFGTSLAAPTFASILTLLNEERAVYGKGPIGFVNPVLYANPGVLNDIVNGTSLGCDSDGFQAVPGWDPATGLGTANYPKMKSLFLSLP